MNCQVTCYYCYDCADCIEPIFVFDIDGRYKPICQEHLCGVIELKAEDLRVRGEENDE